MEKFSIEYNPYEVSYVFRRNNERLSRDSKFVKYEEVGKDHPRLQMLFGKSANWEGLLAEIENASDCDDGEEIALSFKGRKIDFEDLEYAVNLYQGNARFALQFEETRNDNDIIREFDKIIHNIKEKDHPEFNKPDEEGKTIFDTYEEVKNGIFEVSVIATMSSGKSTLINSLLHTELLPSKNAACTATIARILDNDDMEGYEATCYAADGRTEVHPREKVTLEDLEKYNEDENVRYIDIEGDIPAVSSDKIKLCLRDTPGPNNSQNEQHGEITSSIIRSTNAVVLYVINATQVGIKDDKHILEDISSEMKKAGKQSRDKFIFVVNKCDDLDEEKETLEELLDNIRKYLKEFGIVEPILIPTSARMALLIRRNRKGEKLSRAERHDLGTAEDFVEYPELHFEKYAVLSPAVSDKLRDEVSKYHQGEETWDMEALIHTGVPAVEQTIKEYIDKYVYPIKIRDAVSGVRKKFQEFQMNYNLDEKIVEDENAYENVQRQILDAERKQSEGEKVLQEYKERINSFSVALDEHEELIAVELEQNKMTAEYNDKTEVDKADADRLISEFQEKLEEFQKENERRLNRSIDEQIFQKGEEMLEDYERMVKNILGGIKIDGFDFRKINSFDKIRIKNIDDIKRRNEQDRYREETRWKDNPERSGFWGKFKLWKPKTVSYTVSVKDGVNVNVENIIVSIMDEFSRSIKGNISSMFAQANAQVEEYKGAFCKNIDKLGEEIRKIIKDLKKKTKDREEIQKRVEENKELANWVAERENEINTLLRF